MSDVTIVGSINVDLTSYLDRWPQVGETVSARETLISLGGKGANQAVAASRMGANTAIVGAIGSDAFGADAKRQLLDYDLQLNLHNQTDRATGMAFIDVGPDGGNIIRLSPGANAVLTDEIIGAYSEAIAGSKVVLLQNEIPIEASVKAAEIARASGATVMMDPAPAPEPFWNSDVLAKFDILTPNASETGIITGYEPTTLGEAEQAARKLQEFGVKGSIVTMGHMGVAWFWDGKTGTMVAPKVNSIDTVAAGDCFNGAFAAAFASGKSVEASMNMAVNAAALATTRKGAASSVPTYEELISALVPT